MSKQVSRILTKRSKISLLIGSFFLLSAYAGADAVAAETDVKRPNIVVILGDDLGFSDLGSFGSEINTPNFDALANEGVRFTNFYTNPSSSPTRSTMLTGIDTHLNGLGNMDEWTAPNQKGVPGYEGYLSKQLVTLPQLLKDVGYHTYMVGKWHLGKTPDLIPAARGFERDFTLLDGAGSYWDMTNVTAASSKSVFTEDGKYLTELPDDYYATKTYTDKLIEFIDSNKNSNKPFFAYVSHQAPHDPYHLPKDWRNRHIGEYDKGWDAVREQRLNKQIELGIMPAGTNLAERMWFLPDPIVLAPVSRSLLGKKMELYAGLVENLDHHTGRLIQHLKDIGEYDNTIFIVFGDNGAEGNDLFEQIAGTPGTRDFLNAAINWSQTHPNSWGDPGSYVAYGPMWAQVSMTPFSQYKGWVAEGGVHNALIVKGPVVQRQHGSINNGIMHVADLMPTLLEVAGAKYPDSYQGHKLPSLAGKSWLPTLMGKTESPRTAQDYIAWEVFGNRALRQGDWKIRWQFKPFGKGEWELFNLVNDPAERIDLTSKEPVKLNEMLKLWDHYVKANNVIIPSRSPFETLDDVLPMRTPVETGYPPLLYKKQFVPPPEMVEKQDK